MTMVITINRKERERQKALLRTLYPDYNPKQHDVFVMRYQKEQEDKALQNYLQTRGLLS